MVGFIYDHRQELESDIWKMPPLYHRTWQYLKYIVNHSDNEIPMRDGTKFQIKRGQHLTSYRNIAKNIGWYEGSKWKEPNPKTVQAICVWLEKNKMISINHGKGNSEYTLVTIANYDLYQSNIEQGNSKVTVSGQGRKQRADINNNDKEMINNEKNIYSDFSSNPVLVQALNDFEKMRNSLKNGKMTDKARTMLLKKLDGLANTDEKKIAILEESILNNWKGVFPLKETVQKSTFKNSTPREYDNQALMAGWIEKSKREG